MEKIVIIKSDANKKIASYIHSLFPNKTISFIKKNINRGNVKVNNQKVRDNYLLKENDVITHFLKNKITLNNNYFKCNLKLNIFYEDDNIIIIDKQKNTLCQEDVNEKINTLNNAIRKYCFENKLWDGSSLNEPSLIHRLDKNTTGLLIAGKNKEIVKILNEEMKNKNIIKKYIAFVHGNFKQEEMELKGYIKKHNSKNIMIVSNKKSDEHFKPIHTYLKKIYSSNNYSILEVTISSGKKHQIRSHLSWYGFPIIGDYKYSNTNHYDNKQKSQMLISNEIIFNLKNDKLKYLNEIQFKKYKQKEIEGMLNL